MNGFTDRGDRGELEFLCSDIFEIDLGKERCVFYDDETVAITRTKISTFKAGDSVTLKNNTLRVRADRDPCGLGDMNTLSTTVTLLPPLRAQGPIAIAAVPQRVGGCSNLEADASASVGVRPLQYRWTVLSNNNKTFYDSPTLTFSATRDLATLTTMTLNLTVIDHFGLESQVVTSQVDIVSGAIPELTIAGGLQQTTRAWKALSIFANAKACSETTAKKKLTYSWNASSSSSNYPLTSTSADPRYFELSAYTLTAGSRLRLNVRVTDDRGSYNEAFLTVDVLKGDVIASIDGTRGSSRSALVEGQLSLDASTTYDEDDPQAKLNFSWACAFYFDDNMKHSCDAYYDTANTLSSSTFAMIPKAASAGGVFELTVVATTTDGRNDTASALVSVLADRRAPAVTIKAQTAGLHLDKVNPSTRLVLLASVESKLNNTKVRWRRVDSNEASSTLGLLVDSPTSKVLSATSTTVPLVLRPDALVPGASYAFSLTATSTSGSSSVATIDIICNVAPRSGSIAVSPATGVALTTRFSLSADNWIDTDLPLRYNFYQRAPATATNRALVVGDLVSPHYAGAYFTASTNQTNAIVLDVSDAFGATATVETTVELTANAGAKTIAGLENLTQPLLEGALESGDVDLAYQLLSASANLINEVDTTTTSDDNNNETTKSKAAYRRQLLTDFSAIMGVQTDSTVTRARQAELLSALSSSASDDEGKTTAMALDVAVDVSARIRTGGFQAEASRTLTTAAIANALSNIQGSQKNLTTPLLSAVDDVAMGFLIGAVLGQNTEIVVAPSLAFSTTLANDAVDILSPSFSEVRVPPGFFAAFDGNVGLVVVDFAEDMHPSSSSSQVTPTIRFLISGDKSTRRRRLQSEDDESLSVVLRRGGLVVNSTIQSYNLTVDCEGGFVGNKTAQCNGTLERAHIQCDGTAETVTIRCEAITGLACAEYDNKTGWLVEGSFEDLVASTKTNVTCAYRVDVEAPTRDFGATSHSIVQYYVSTVRQGIRPKKLLKQPLLLWTFGIMIGCCIAVALIGSHLDHRDSTKLSKIIAGGGDDSAAGGNLATKRKAAVYTVRTLAQASLPQFVKEIKNQQVFGHAMRLVWRNHSILTIFTRYDPAHPRHRRAFLLLFSMLMIMLSQVCAMWVAFPVGYCEQATDKDDCDAKKDLYEEVVINVAAALFGVRDKGDSRGACRWRLNRPDTEDKCQLRVPSPRDIGTKRLGLVFFVFALMLPCLAIVEFFFANYACAPIYRPRWAGSSTVSLLRSVFDVVDDKKDEHEEKKKNGSSQENNASDILPAVHVVGLRLWRNLCIEGDPASYKPLKPEDYYALRALMPVMRALHLMRAELEMALRANAVDPSAAPSHTNAIDPRRHRALKFLIKDLDKRWGIGDAVKAVSDDKGSLDARQLSVCSKFARKTLAQLKRNLCTAAAWEPKFAALSQQGPSKACCLVMHLMRRDYLSRGEQALLDNQISNDGAFEVVSGSWKRGRPVSLLAKLLASVLCVVAFVIPIWFIFTVSAKLDAAGQAGKRTKRAIYFKTMVFVFFTYFTVEPFAIIVLKFAVPATLYHKLRFYTDPAPLVVPYESARLYVEPCALLSPLAASDFYETCHKIPLRLGPFAAERALRAQETKHHEEEFAGVTLTRRRYQLSGTSEEALKKQLVNEAAGNFASFAQSHPTGAEGDDSDKQTNNKDSDDGGENNNATSDEPSKIERYANKKGRVYGKSSKASSLAGDLHRNLRFSPPKSHVALSVGMLLVILLPEVARSIAIREMIVLGSFLLDALVSYDIFERFRRALEAVDKVVPGGSEALFLWSSMAFVVFSMLALATVVTITERQNVARSEQVRNAIGQRLDYAQHNDQSTRDITKNAPEKEADFLAAKSVKGSSMFLDDDIRSYDHSDSDDDSLDGFICAGKEAAEIAENHRRRTSAGSILKPPVTPLSTEGLSEIDAASTPMACMVYAPDFDDEEDDDKNKPGDDAQKGGQKMGLLKHFNKQAEKQLLYGVREMRGGPF